MAGKKDTIYIQQWLSFHPYDSPKQTDFYYLKLCNEIYRAFQPDEFPDEEIALSDEGMMDLACFLVCYFEDVISGPGLWRAFTTQVQELYGTPLPFFDTEHEEYYPDEINPEDIHFLMWYYLSMVFREESVISPEIHEWSDQSERIFEILEREYERAPENITLQKFYQVSLEEDNFFEIREKMKWIVLESWLHYFLGEEVSELVHQLTGEGADPDMDEESRYMYLYDAIDTFVLNRHTPLLATRGKDWLAYLLGKDHLLHGSLLEMGEKNSGFFIFMGEENNDLVFIHIATETLINVTSRSVEIPASSQPGKSIFYGGFVKWKGEWWFSGAQLGWGYNEELIRKEQESGESKKLFGKEPAEQRKENRLLHKAFLEFNQGSPLAFVENITAADEFMQEFISFHNRNLMKSGGNDQKGRSDRRQTEQLKEMDPQDPKMSVPGMVYCDPESGLALAFGYNDYIPDPRNKWYKEEMTEEERTDGATRMLESKYISGRWMKYLVSEYDIPGLEFPGLGGRELLLDNLDFMLRFWKRKAYYGQD